MHDHQGRFAGRRVGAATRTRSRSLPAAKTPHELYGRWTPRSWTDGAGSHDVHAPADRDISLRFEERSLGPVIVYEADCSGTAIADVTYDDGAITFDPTAQTSERRGLPRCVAACPALHTPVRARTADLRYQLAGNTLTVENVSARVTVVATRAR